MELISIPLTPGQAVYDVDPATVMILGAGYPPAMSPRRIGLSSSLDRDTYAAFPDKDTPGPPTQYWYNPTCFPPSRFGSRPMTAGLIRCASIARARYKTP